MWVGAGPLGRKSRGQHTERVGWKDSPGGVEDPFYFIQDPLSGDSIGEKGADCQL